MSCGALAHSAEFVARLPGEKIVVPYAPQQQLLARVAAFVTHAGAGSVMEASFYGVPMLAIPIIVDQPANAHVVANVAKTGLQIAPEALTEASCREALEVLLSSETIRVNTQRVRDSYRSRDGAALAAEALLGLCGDPAGPL